MIRFRETGIVNLRSATGSDGLEIGIVKWEENVQLSRMVVVV